jgi:mannose-1-phosphate guanylyltransferase
MITPVILSGGSGTRLWPLSRKLYPKQFINLVNETSLFQDTVLRLPKDMEKPIVICNEEHRFIAAEQLRQIEKKSNGIILEPEGKNTAPAIALAALNELSNNRDSILLVLSADHVIEDITSLHNSIEIAKKHAANGKLVTFGVFPNKPETGYGYIEIYNKSSKNYFDIKSFIEKPNEISAKKYIKEGNYLWNTGMFMFKASIYLNELQKFEPKIYDCCLNSFDKKLKDNEFIRLKNHIFSQCDKKSIDYAVMEQTKNGVVIPLKTNWSDVGSWNRLLETKIKDKKGNFLQGDVKVDNVNNSFIHSSHRLITVAGVSDLVIVETKDSVLISEINKSSNISKIVDILNKEKRDEAYIHRKVFRPWGFYDLIDSGDGYQVKQLQVNPGSKLSLQKHQHRSEHWIVTSGKAKVTCGKNTFELKENESTFIPIGELHRLENQGEKPLEIIEVQTGHYLGEDDIIRLEDDYQRSS